MDKLLAAAKSARYFIRRIRQDVVDAHCNPSHVRKVSAVTDRYALSWIAEHDKVLKKLDKAIAEYEGKQVMNLGHPFTWTPSQIAESERREAALNDAYAVGRSDQLEDDKRLLAWAYSKLQPFSFSKQDDALAMDEIKLLLMGG